MTPKDDVRQRSEKMSRDLLRREGVTGREAREVVMREGGWRAFLYARGKGPMMRAVDVANEDGMICQCCYFQPRDARELTIDHVRPLKDGGADNLGNWALLCHSCNTIKGSTRTIPETRELMERRGWAYERPADFRDVLERIGASRSRT